VGAPPPAYIVSSYSSLSPRATPLELSKDYKVIVKLPNISIVKTFYHLYAVEIKNCTKKVYIKAFKTTIAIILTTI
jgi:hypothetical protein